MTQGVDENTYGMMPFIIHSFARPHPLGDCFFPMISYTRKDESLKFFPKSINANSEQNLLHVVTGNDYFLVCSGHNKYHRLGNQNFLQFQCLGILRLGCQHG